MDMQTQMQRIIDHFTDQSMTRKFMGWDKYGKAILSDPMASPLSFIHNDSADHSGPLQRGCDSCFPINAARVLPDLKGKAQKAWAKEMREAVARFGDENPEATADILDALKGL